MIPRILTKVRPIQFGGHCPACNSSNDTPTRAGVEIATDGEDADFWICIRCARSLASKILVACAAAQLRTDRGQEYVNGRWNSMKAAHKARSKKPTTD
jgi:hypothetical protein